MKGKPSFNTFTGRREVPWLPTLAAMAAAQDLDADALDAAVLGMAEEERRLDAEIAQLRADTLSAVSSGLPELAVSEVELGDIAAELAALTEASESSYALVSGSGAKLAELRAQKQGLEETIELLDRMLELDRREEAAVVRSSQRARPLHPKAL